MKPKLFRRSLLLLKKSLNWILFISVSCKHSWTWTYTAEHMISLLNNMDDDDVWNEPMKLDCFCSVKYDIDTEI